METTLTINDFLVFGALMASVYGAGFLHVRALRTDMNRQFDKAEKNAENAHHNIGENIRSVERQVEKGLDRVHLQLAAITPRAAAEQETPRPA